MVKVHTGYVANIAGGIVIGFVAGGFVAASLVLVPLVWILWGDFVGAIIGGIGGGLWVFRNRHNARSREVEDAETR